MLVSCSNDNQQVIKYLNFWTDQEDFLLKVKTVWEDIVQGNPMWRLHKKLKTLAKELSKWSRECIGDVFQRVKELEHEVTSTCETSYLLLDAEADRKNLNRSKAKYIRWLKMEDSILRQKARLKWATDGDSNTKYFHSTIREKRRKAKIYKIKDKQGQWVEGNHNISEAAIEYFNHMFTGQTKNINLDFIRDCDNLINADDNENLTKTPNRRRNQNGHRLYGLKQLCWVRRIQWSFLSVLLGHHQG